MATIDIHPSVPRRDLRAADCVTAGEDGSITTNIGAPYTGRETTTSGGDDL